MAHDLPSLGGGHLACGDHACGHGNRLHQGVAGKIFYLLRTKKVQKSAMSWRLTLAQIPIGIIFLDKLVPFFSSIKNC